MLYIFSSLRSRHLRFETDLIWQVKSEVLRTPTSQDGVNPTRIAKEETLPAIPCGTCITGVRNRNRRRWRPFKYRAGDSVPFYPRHSSKLERPTSPTAGPDIRHSGGLLVAVDFCARYPGALDVMLAESNNGESGTGDV